MHFNDLTIDRFGPHEHLELKSLGSLVGLVGPYGRGKTHVLNAVEMLINGSVERAGAQETFVHNTGMEGIDPTFDLAGNFIAFNEEGYLRRIGGKKSERHLHWGGKKYKGDTAVMEKLNELFDLGKRSLAATVFLRQGEIRSGLFTTPTAREDMMLKILALENMVNIEKASNKKKAAVIGNLPDLAPVRDQASFAYNQARADYEAADKTLTESVDFSPDINSLRALGSAKHAVSSSEESVQQCVANETSHTIAFNALLSEAPAQVSVAEFRLVVQQLAETLNGHENRLTNLTQLAQMIQTRDGLEKTATAVQVELEALRKERPGIVMFASQEKLDGLRNMAAQLETAKRAKQRGDTAAAVFESAKASLLALGTRPMRVSRQTEIDAANQRRTDLKPSVDLITEFERRGGDVTCRTCPTCQNALDPSTFNLAELAQARATYLQLQADITKMTAEDQANQRTVDVYDREMAIRTHAQESAQREFEAALKASMELAVVDGVPENLQEQIANQTRLVARLNTIDSVLPIKEAELQRTQTQLAGLPADLPASVDVLPVQQARDAARAEWANANARLTTLMTAEQRVAQLAAVTESHRQDLANKIIVARSAELALTVQAKATLAILEHDIMRAIADLELKQAAWLAASGSKTAAKRIMDDASVRLNQLDEQIAKQVTRRLVAGKLERLATAFGRQGVPSAIVQDRWSLLIALTQAYLRQSESTFSVRVSQDLPVSVDFLIHTNASAGYRPMSKMSGGEGMIFAVRFALAVQQLLTPRLGLLALDEPSTHLPDEAVQHLGTVLRDLTVRLQNANAQIWVSDHHKSLVPFFETTVELAPLKLELV